MNAEANDKACKHAHPKSANHQLDMSTGLRLTVVPNFFEVLLPTHHNVFVTGLDRIHDVLENMRRSLGIIIAQKRSSASRQPDFRGVLLWLSL